MGRFQKAFRGMVLRGVREADFPPGKDKQMYLYDEDFFASGEKQSREIAQIVMSYMINWIKPESVVDFGCGEGIWLKAVSDIDKDIRILGIDGDYINRKRLKIPVNCFLAADLEKGVKLDCRYDLAISLEVAEHLDEKSSDLFADSVARASDRILFSAAVPGQGGENHINEQWQDYWIEKFAARGYLADTSVRNFFWKEERITPWRRQNILFFSKEKTEPPYAKKEIYNVVHPQMFEYKTGNGAGGSSVKEIYCKMDEKIKDLVSRGFENFVIYPFGENGYLCKEILNYKYRINEIAIADNKLCRQRPEIIPVSRLADIKERYCVIENCSNIEVHKDVLNEIRKYVSNGNIFTVFEEAK